MDVDDDNKFAGSASSSAGGSAASPRHLNFIANDMPDDGPRCVVPDAPMHEFATTLFAKWHDVVPLAADRTDGKDMDEFVLSLSAEAKQLYEFVSIDLVYGTTEKAYAERRKTAFLSDHKAKLPMSLGQARDKVLSRSKKRCLCLLLHRDIADRVFRAVCLYVSKTCWCEADETFRQLATGKSRRTDDYARRR